MHDHDLALVANAVFRKSTRNLFPPWGQGRRKPRGAHTQPWGWSACGRPRRVLPRPCGRSEACAGGGPARSHQAEAAELPRSAPSAGSGWKRREEPLPLPADEAVPLLPPAAPTPPLTLIWLLIQPDAEPVRFTEPAENKPRNEWKNKNGSFCWLSELGPGLAERAGPHGQGWGGGETKQSHLTLPQWDQWLGRDEVSVLLWPHPKV